MFMDAVREDMAVVEVTEEDAVREDMAVVEVTEQDAERTWQWLK